MKGIESVKEAARVLTAASGSGFTYHGFVEGDDIGKGTVDVVVTDGFTGNIALKTAEGTARQVGTYVRAAMQGRLHVADRRAVRRPGASPRSAASSIRAAPMAASSSASTASSSRATAAPTRSASRARSASPTKWPATG